MALTLADRAYKQGFSSFIQSIQHLQNSELRRQGASSYQARRIKIYRASETIISHLQIKIKNSLQSSSADLHQPRPSIKPSEYSSHQEIESEDNFYCIKFRDCTYTLHQYKIKFVSEFLVFIYFRLEICVYKFLARSVGQLCLSSLSLNSKQYIPLKITWPLRTLLTNLQGKLSDLHRRDQQLLVLHLVVS